MANMFEYFVIDEGKKFSFANISEHLKYSKKCIILNFIYGI